jgi:hypothetical protein
MGRSNPLVTPEEYGFFLQEVTALKGWAGPLRAVLFRRYGKTARAVEWADRVVKLCDKLAELLHLRYGTELRPGLEGTSNANLPSRTDHPTCPLSREEHAALGTNVTNRAKVWCRLSVSISNRCNKSSPVGRGATRLYRAVEGLRNELDNQSGRDLDGKNVDLYYY